MTSVYAAAEESGTSGVLVLWSVVALIIVIGGGLFTYSIVINMRGGRGTRGRRRPPPDDRRLPARQMPLPAGPMVGGQPVLGRPGGMGYPEPGEYPDERPLALPPGRGRRPEPPPLQSPIALPSGPVVGSGYSDVPSAYGTPGRPVSALPASAVPASGTPARGSRSDRYDYDERHDPYGGRSRYDEPRHDGRRYDDRYDEPRFDDRGFDDRGLDDRRYDDRRFDDRRYDERRFDDRRYDEPRYGERGSRSARAGRSRADDPDALYDPVPGYDSDRRRGDSWHRAEPEPRREPPSRYEALVGPPLRDPPISKPREPKPPPPASPPPASTPPAPAPPAPAAPAPAPPAPTPSPADATATAAPADELTRRVPLYPGATATPAPSDATSIFGTRPVVEPTPPPRSPECAALWTEADALAERAKQAHTAAATAVSAAQAAEAAHATALRAAQDAKEAHEAVVKEAAEVAAELSRLEKLGPALVDERTQQETSHAAFVAFRRGDITADQLREVFKRAEGWTPEHDRLTKRTTDLRTEEATAARARIEAERAVAPAAEQARSARATANALEAAAREADNAARLRKTAAEECEARSRRR